MAHYKHTKGKIRDNALEALLHDPLFRARVEVNQKGKGSFKRKDKHHKKGNWEASGKANFTTGLLLNDRAIETHSTVAQWHSIAGSITPYYFVV